MRARRAALMLGAALAVLSTAPAAPLDSGRAPDGFRVRLFDERSGLPQSSVMAIAQTADGYLWAGTLEGLARFDGARFTVFDRHTNPELASQRISALALDPAGYLFVGTEGGGVFRFDGGAFAPAASVGREAPSTVRALLVDRRGELWIGGSNRLWRLTSPDLLEPVQNGIDVWNLLEASDGTLWAAAADGVWRREGARFSRLALPQPWAQQPARALSEEPDGSLLASLWNGAGVVRLRPGERGWNDPQVEELIPAVAVIHILRDRDGTLWLSGEGDGLLRWDGRELQRHGVADGFPSRFVLALGEDREGSLWVGADGAGLAQLREGPFEALSRRHGLAGDLVVSVLESRTGDLWVGGYGHGLDRVRRIGSRLEVEHFGRAEGLPDLWIWTLLEDRSGDLWVGTYQGLVRMRGGRVTSERFDLGYGTWVRALLEQESGALWIGSDYGLHRLHAGKLTALARGKEAPHVTALAASPAGTVWVGTSGGLLRADGDALAEVDHPALAAATIRALHLDHEGVLWIGTEGDGLLVARVDARVDARIEGATVARITVREGLHDDLVSAIVEDDFGSLWLSSNRGLFRVAKRELLAVANGEAARVSGRQFDAADGMPSRETTGGSPQASSRGGGGRLHFATIRGVASVAPARLADDLPPPQAIVESVSLDGAVLAATGGSLELPPGGHTLRIDFTAPSFVAPERLRFRHRLDGYDTEWIEADSRRSASYTNLPPGRFRFRVSASTGDVARSAGEASVELLQRPFLWERRSFRWAAVAAALIALGAAVRLRMHALTRSAAALEGLVAERTASLEREKRTTEEQAARLARVEADKSRFFANLTHELRTPLALVLGPVESALDGELGPLSGRLAEKLRIVRRSAREQLRLVDQLLQLARADSGALVLRPSAVAVDELLAGLVAAFSSLAERRRIALTLDVAEPLPEVSADAERLEQVFSNLLSNAIKFGREGGSVRIEARAEGEEIAVTVTDDGPGIPSATLARLFDRYYRGDAGGVAFGVGIGLHLARDLVTLHSGRLDVESEEGVGTVFTVRLPLRLATGASADWRPGIWSRAAVESVEDALAARAEEPAMLEGDGGRPAGAERAIVLVVEDHPELARQLAEQLGAEFATRTAANGEEALAAIEREMPDLVVSDVLMPGGDGFELCRAIRESPALDHLAIVLLTALSEREDRLAGLRVGADAYLAKPVDREELLVVARGLVERRRALRARFGTAPEIRVADLAATPLDEQFLGRAVTAVEARIDDPQFGVEELAKALAMSPRNLQRKLRALTGATPHEFVLELRLQRAVQLLTASAGNVSQVAYQVGFSEPSSFSRAYRRRYGRPPSAAARGA